MYRNWLDSSVLCRTLPENLNFILRTHNRADFCVIGEAMRHGEIRWNPELQEWFCVRCGLTSDHTLREDAQAEMELFECELPTNQQIS
jgi:hypothetical protein